MCRDASSVDKDLSSLAFVRVMFYQRPGARYSLGYPGRVARRHPVEKAPQVIIRVTKRTVVIVSQKVVRKLVEKPQIGSSDGECPRVDGQSTGTRIDRP